MVLRSKPPAFSPRRHQSEYHENAALAEEFEGPSPRRAFDNALSEYASSNNSIRRAKLIEAIIRTSRGIADDCSQLMRAERRTMELIRTHYAVFASTEVVQEVTTYKDARDLLRFYFF